MSSYRYGTVTQTGPLRVHLEGDSAAKDYTPTSLVVPVVGDKVLCVIDLGRVVVLGVVQPNP